MFGVYILKCRDQSYYTGHTDNLDNRIFQHQNKLIPRCYTSPKLPVQLVYSQEFSSREEALGAEQQIKGWSRRKKEALICGDWLPSVNLSAKASRRAMRSSARTDFIVYVKKNLRLIGRPWPQPTKEATLFL